MMYISDNPVRDAERHEEELEEAGYACCAECGERIYLGDEVYEYNGNYFCSEECLMDSLEVRVRYLEKEDLKDFD